MIYNGPYSGTYNGPYNPTTVPTAVKEGKPTRATLHPKLQCAYSVNVCVGWRRGDRGLGCSRTRRAGDEKVHETNIKLISLLSESEGREMFSHITTCHVCAVAKADASTDTVCLSLSLSP